MKVDSQGRIGLGQKRCEELNYRVGEWIRFIYLGDRTYRLIRFHDALNIEDKVAGLCLISSNCRINIPSEIRELYTSSVLVYEKTDGYIYLEFLVEKNFETEKLISAIEELTREVKILNKKIK